MFNPLMSAAAPTASRPLFADAPVMQQPTAAPAQTPGSTLAAALMKNTAMPQQGAPNMSFMAPLFNQSGNGQSNFTKWTGNTLGGGLSNWLQGYNWNGTPGAGVMQDLSNQAASNAAGGAAGL